MKKTNNGKEIAEMTPLSVNTEELQKILGCGRNTATDIGENANAKIKIGKRVLWNVSKIRKYIDYCTLEGDTE